MKPSGKRIVVAKRAVASLCLFALGASGFARAEGSAQSDFQKVMGDLLSHYVDSGLSSETLYRNALAGMLSGLSPAHPDWNRLYTPEEAQELQSELSGNIIGIGVAISLDSASGTVNVLQVLAGSPAEQAGLQAGDRIHEIDGQSVAGKKLDEIVKELRGAAGSSVTVSVERGTRTFPVTLTREPLSAATLESTQLANGVYRLAIHRFNDQTPDLLKAALAELSRNHDHELVVDLRGNAGGALSAVEATAALLVPDGTPLAIRVNRDGSQEKIATRGTPLLSPLTVTVVADSTTACGAEMLAEALKNSLGATIVGSRTAGKWNAQAIDTLPDGFAYRYTVATFLGARGETFDGVGIVPDVAGLAALQSLGLK